MPESQGQRVLPVGQTAEQPAYSTAVEFDHAATATSFAAKNQAGEADHQPQDGIWRGPEYGCGIANSVHRLLL